MYTYNTLMKHQKKIIFLTMFTILTREIINGEVLDANNKCLLFSLQYKNIVNLSQYKQLQTGDIRSIIFIYNDTEEKHISLLKEIFNLHVPLYVMNIAYNVTDIFTPEQEIFFDNTKLYVFYLRNLKRIDEMVRNKVQFLKQLSIWKKRDKILFITDTNSIQSYDTKVLQRYCLKNKLLNFSFLFLSEGNLIYVYNSFKNRMIKNVDTINFKDTVRDLNGYEIVVCMFEEPVSATKVNDSFRGRDGFTATSVLRLMNASYRLKSPEDGNFFGSFNATFMSGSARDLILETADVGFNGRLLVVSFNRLDFTFPHQRGDLVALVPVATDHRQLLESLPSAVWITSGIISIHVYLYMLLAKKTTRQQSTVFLMIILIITGRSVKEMRAKYFRLFLMSVMVLSIFLNTIFCSNFASYLTVPRYPPVIRTLRELAASKYPIIATPTYRNKLNISLVSELKDRIISKVNVINMKQQQETILKCDEQIIICKVGLAKIVLNEGAGNCYVVMEEHVMPSWISYSVSYGSPFLERFNEIILMIGEAGLGDLWSRREVKTDEEREFNPIGLGFMYDPLKVYFVGIVSAILALLYEMLQHKFRNV